MTRVVLKFRDGLSKIALTFCAKDREEARQDAEKIASERRLQSYELEVVEETEAQ